MFICVIFCIRQCRANMSRLSAEVMVQATQRDVCSVVLQTV